MYLFPKLHFFQILAYHSMPFGTTLSIHECENSPRLIFMQLFIWFSWLMPIFTRWVCIKKRSSDRPISYYCLRSLKRSQFSVVEIFLLLFSKSSKVTLFRKKWFMLIEFFLIICHNFELRKSICHFCATLFFYQNYSWYCEVWDFTFWIRRHIICPRY